jgi:hypothetical protein
MNWPSENGRLIWRVLMSWKRFGFGYSGNENEKPGINLLEIWRKYENRCVY